MTDFPDIVEEYWFGRRHCRHLLCENGTFSLVTDSELDPKVPLTVLETAGPVCIRVTVVPGLARDLGFDSSTRCIDDVWAALDRAGMTLHGADDLFYFSAESHAGLVAEADPPGIRILNKADANAFAEFLAHCPQQDLEDAYIELDHWLVVGAFDANRLVCVASMYPWGNDSFADTGVLTLPCFRGNGYAQRVVRAISRHAIGRGYEPQYRCQLDNGASIALAGSAGLALFGTWDSLSAD